MTARSQTSEARPAGVTGKAATLLALAAALAGGTGGFAITPMVRTPDAYVTKTDLAEALSPIASDLKEIRGDVTNLREEVAVARYAREHAAAGIRP